MMHRASRGWALLFVLGALGCGGATVEAGGTVPPPGGGTVTVAAYGGSYRGMGALDVQTQTPVQRVVPTRNAIGTVDVTDNGGGSYTFDVRLYDGGNVCRLQGTQSPGGASFQPGQRCFAQMMYDGTPADIAIQVNTGGVTWHAGGLTLTMSGPFVSDVHTPQGTLPASGTATWRIDARR
ncbi:MAG: hypothetical protein IT379_41625 [Deltaproteobacteria bacterium]|nr:hypothetical protein [Deltaproteobacteria bacterium]